MTTSMCSTDMRRHFASMQDMGPALDLAEDAALGLVDYFREGAQGCYVQENREL